MAPVFVSLLFIAPAQAPDSFPDTPANHWVYEAAGIMKSRGLMVGLPDGLGYFPINRSKTELAVAFHAAANNLKTLLSEFRTDSDRIAHEPAGSASAKSDLATWIEFRK